MPQEGENHLTQDQPTGDTSSVNVDELMDKIENGGEVSPQASGGDNAPSEVATDTPSSTERQEAPNAAGASTPSEEYEFKWNGKTVKAPRDKIIQWASQGYDYAQKVNQLKTQEQEFQSKMDELEQQFNHYKTIDEYARNNPEWWQRIQQQFQADQLGVGSQQQQGGEVSPEILALKQELDDLKRFKQDYISESQRAQERQEDEQLEQEIESVRKQYSNLDWDSLDESGMTLEQRVLDHGMKIGTNSFEAAFIHLNKDKLIKLAQEQAQEKATQSIQRQNKAGLLGKTSTPVKGVQPGSGVKGKSYEDLMQEAMAEIGIQAG